MTTKTARMRITASAVFLDDVYVAERVHSALGCLTPAEFEALHAIQWFD